jgi:hypothetical protein
MISSRRERGSHRANPAIPRNDAIRALEGGERALLVRKHPDWPEERVELEVKRAFMHARG